MASYLTCLRHDWLLYTTGTCMLNTDADNVPLSTVKWACVLLETQQRFHNLLGQRAAQLQL